MFEIKETAQHLSKLLKSDSTGIQSINITSNAVEIFYKENRVLGLINIDKEPSVLEHIFNNVGVNPDMCIDCMTDDNMRNSEFFQYQMKAYIYFLTLKYGKEVSISYEMASYFLRHDLLEYHTIYSVETGANMTKEGIKEGGFHDGDNFILVYEQ